MAHVLGDTTGHVRAGGWTMSALAEFGTSHANTFSEPNRDSYGDSNSNAYGYSYSKLDCQAHSHAKSSADARTAPVKASKLIVDS